MRERPTALVVDDDQSALTLIHAILDRNEIEMVACSDPRQAVALAMSTRPDVIVLDLMMPGISGLEVLEILRSDPATTEIPVLILSAKGGGTDRVHGLKAGADDYLTKPFEPEELAIRLHRLAGRSRDTRTTILSGKLGQLAAGDILQQILVSGVTGTLELDGTPAGHVTVANGAILDARCGTLQGEQALIVLLERREGNFRLVEHRADVPSDAEPLSLNGTLMLLAWLEDEIERRHHLAPAEDILLEAEAGGKPPEGECSQLGTVLAWYRVRGAASLGQLEKAMIVAPQQARLATLLLLEAGLLHPYEGSEPAPTVRTESPATPARPRLHAACGALAHRAESVGRASDVLHVLVGIGPERWDPFLEELVRGIPAGLLERPIDPLLAELRRDGSASLRIPCSESTLLLHVHQLSGLAGLRARAFLAMTTAVVLAPAPSPNAQTIDILEAAAALNPPPVLLVVPPEEGLGENVQRFSEWRFSNSIPPNLEALLELLH